MLGGTKKMLGLHDKKKEDNEDSNGKKISDLEGKIESLHKIVRERDATIVELKEKNHKQEKKIEEHTRAKIMKEKNAIMDELKERTRRQQKKDDATRARLAHPDSPVTKAVLDKTLLENTELHLRMEAVLLQVQEDKKANQELTKLADKYKHDLDACMSRTHALERELEANRNETRRMQLQIIELRESLHLSNAQAIRHGTSSTPTPTITTTPAPASALSTHQRPTSPLCVTPPSEAPSPIPSPKASPIPSPRTAPTLTPNGNSNSNHINPEVPHNAYLPSHEAAPTSLYESYDLGDLSPDAPPSRAYESYDLGSLAKDLDFPPLVTSSSELDLLKSLDNLSGPAQSIDFVSLAHDAQADDSELDTNISPTARVDVEPPFHTNSAQYNHDFMEMFSPADINGNNYKGRDRRAKDLGPGLTNLFFIEEDKSTPPSFNLEGIDTTFLTNHDPPRRVPPTSANSEPTLPTIPPENRPSSPSPLAASLPVFAGARSPSPSNLAASYQPRSHSPQLYRHSAPYASLQTETDSPTNRRGHKSIFSLFSGPGDSNGTDTPSDHSPSNRTNSPTHSPYSPPHSPTSSQAHGELLLNFSSKADINKVGLRRAKKVNIAAFAKGKAKADPIQEDTHFCIYPYAKTKTKALFAVFDGHAGRGAADEAADLFPKEFNARLERSEGDVGKAFTSTFEDIDIQMKQFEYLGTTATVVYLWMEEGSKYLQAANVGDSTAFLCRNGVATRLTVDHKPSLPEEKERMRLQGIEIGDSQTRINGLAVSRSLGNHFVKEQHIGMIATPYVCDRIEIKPTDTYLIVASDGLWDVVNSQHAMDIIRGLDAMPAAGLLLSTALQSTKCNDNVTVIVVRLN